MTQHNFSHFGLIMREHHQLTLVGRQQLPLHWSSVHSILPLIFFPVPLLGFRPSDVGVSPLRGAAAEQQEVTSPVPRSFDTVLEARPRFADPPPRKEAPLPLLRIRIKSQAWTRPVIVVAEPPGAAFKKPFVAGHSVRTFPPVKTGPQAGRSQRSPSLDLNGLQSCGSTKSFQFAVPGPTQGFGAVGNEGGSVFKKRRAGGRHKRKDAWPGKPFQEPMLTNPLVATFTSEGGSPLEGLNTEDGVAGFSGREFGESGAGEAAAQVGEESEAEFVDNISRRPGLRVVRRRVHVAPEEDGEGGEGESPGRQAKWKRKAPRAPQVRPEIWSFKGRRFGGPLPLMICCWPGVERNHLGRGFEGGPYAAREQNGSPLVV